ncbi:MAG: ATP-binding cassette domain-containing protein [Eubacteriales bacterium]
MIHVSGLRKTFKVARRGSGALSGLRSFFRPEYKYITALDGISFNIAKGEIVGYIGPNGAGKSTTVKVMSGILVPDGGECVIGGLVPWKDRRRHVSRIGVVFGQRSQLWWDTPVLDSFELLRNIYRVPDQAYRSNLSELTDCLSLSELLRTPVRQLSLGQRMRCEAAAALLHSPDLLFLDEPTIGLDASSKLALREFIRHINRTQGVTVILTTHDTSDIEALCERVMLIGKGSILYDGSFAQLKARFSPEKIIDVSAENIPEDISIEGTRIIARDAHSLSLAVDNSSASAVQVIGRLSEIMEIGDVDFRSMPVDEIIDRLYKEYKI